MVVCANCGEEDFYQQDGFFFCSVCQTQSQQVREEGLERCFEDPDDLPATQVDQASQSQRKKKQRDRGRFWMFEEGITVILKKQVEQLIKWGAKPDLKDKVFKLWVHYLRTNKVAFCEDANWLQNKHTRDFRALEKLRRKGRKSRQTKKSAIEDEDLDGSGDETLADDHTESDSSDDEYCLDLKDLGKRDRAGAQWMTVRKTPVFLYLGLLYSGHNVTFVDLIRWANDNVYPLKDTSNCLNSDMKFIDQGSSASMVFRLKGSPSSVPLLRRECGLIATLLGLEDIPAPDMKQLVASYVVRLALPGELHGMVKYLMAELPTRFKPTSLPLNYDAIAVAYIIIALKLLLGFDDFRERQLSSFARELTKKLKLRQKLFIWDEWVQMQEKRRKRLKQEDIPRNLDDACERVNLEAFVKKQKEVCTKEKVYKPSVIHRKEVQREIRRPLESLFKKLPDPADGATSNQPESEPLFSETLMEDFELTPRNEQPSAKTARPFLTEEEQGFSSMTLRYISEGVDFLEHLGNHGIAETTLSMLDSDDHDESVSAQNAQVISAIRQAMLLGLRADREIVDLNDPLTQLSQRLCLKKDCYMIYNFGNDDWHSSYQWLLNLCSEMIYTDTTVIQAQVRVIELVLFKVSSKNRNVQTVLLARQGGHFEQEKIKELEILAADEDDDEEIPLEEEDN